MNAIPIGVTGFHELVDILLPARSGLVVILKAFFDASARPKSGVFCVAGFVFRKLQLQKFDRDWWRLFGKYGGCHMKELTQRRGRFKDIEQEEADLLIKSAVQILRKRPIYGVIVLCNLNEMSALLPKWITDVRHAYPVCCHIAISSVAVRVEEAGTDDRVAYTFEAGDEYSGSAHAFMDRVSKIPKVKDAYRHSGHAFANKADALALQAADVLAWECAKYWDETVGQRIRPMRRSLSHLLFSKHNDLDRGKFRFHHLSGEPLKRYCEQVRQLGLAQIAEQEAKKGMANAQT